MLASHNPPCLEVVFDIPCLLIQLHAPIRVIQPTYWGRCAALSLIDSAAEPDLAYLGDAGMLARRQQGGEHPTLLQLGRQLYLRAVLFDNERRKP